MHLSIYADTVYWFKYTWYVVKDYTIRLKIEIFQKVIPVWKFNTFSQQLLVIATNNDYTWYYADLILIKFCLRVDWYDWDIERVVEQTNYNDTLRGEGRAGTTQSDILSTQPGFAKCPSLFFFL